MKWWRLAPQAPSGLGLRRVAGPQDCLTNQLLGHVDVAHVLNLNPLVGFEILVVGEEVLDLFEVISGRSV